MNHKESLKRITRLQELAKEISPDEQSLGLGEMIDIMTEILNENHELYKMAQKEEVCLDMLQRENHMLRHDLEQAWTALGIRREE